jgi:hypothetical protein
MVKAGFAGIWHEVSSRTICYEHDQQLLAMIAYIDTLLMPLPANLTLYLSCSCYPETMEVILKRGNAAMKAYLFHTENGLYEGETFEDADILAYEDGVTNIPPPDYEHGQVPVFDRQKGAWTVVPVTVVRQLLKVSPPCSSESKT